jgi:hypothetical protein
LSVSVRGTFHQTLGICQVKQPNEPIVKLHFRFSDQTFIHLVRVSSQGRLLAVTCGAGPFLSDCVRIVPLPDIGEEEISMRIPKLRFQPPTCLSTIQPQVLEHGRNGGVMSFYLGGAVLGVEWSKIHPGRIYANVRRYVPSNLTDGELHFTRDVEKPDLSNTVELQVWQMFMSGPELLAAIPGACGITTKECPFYLFLNESPCGNYVASGSEDHNIYIYHLKHKRLLRILANAHTDVVSSVAFWPGTTSNPTQGCMLVSASDDHSIGIWVSSRAQLQQIHAVHSDRTSTS